MTLKGDTHGEHWDVLRSLLPLYQAISSVQIGNGTTCSFWMDVWLGDEALADRCPALYSHCVAKDASVSEMVTIGLQQTMVPRLSNRATLELQEVQGEMANLQLIRTPDQRTLPFFRENHSLYRGEIYHLLKSRGQQPDNRAAFVW